MGVGAFVIRLSQISAYSILNGMEQVSRGANLHKPDDFQIATLFSGRAKLSDKKTFSIYVDCPVEKVCLHATSVASVKLKYLGIPKKQV